MMENNEVDGEEVADDFRTKTFRYNFKLPYVSTLRFNSIFIAFTLKTTCGPQTLIY